MAAVPPPKRTTKGAPPNAAEAQHNLDIHDSGDMVPLNFRVDPAFRRAFKIYASTRGISMKELLDRMFQEYRRSHPLEG